VVARANRARRLVDRDDRGVAQPDEVPEQVRRELAGELVEPGDRAGCRPRCGRPGREGGGRIGGGAVQASQCGVALPDGSSNGFLQRHQV
jgi:hypothetical protein